MSPLEIIELVKALKESGCTSFKHGDLELTFDSKSTPAKTADFDAGKSLKPVSLEIPPSIPEIEPPHIVQQMRSLFKASDEELIDQLFPLPQSEESA